jgi:hypothetical protein
MQIQINKQQAKLILMALEIAHEYVSDCDDQPTADDYETLMDMMDDAMKQDDSVLNDFTS